MTEKQIIQGGTYYRFPEPAIDLAGPCHLRELPLLKRAIAFSVSRPPLVPVGCDTPISPGL